MTHSVCLAGGGQVFIVSPYEWTFSNHPRCRTFPDISAAVTAIMAQQASERAREHNHHLKRKGRAARPAKASDRLQHERVLQ
jgi:hypothetical protein